MEGMMIVMLIPQTFIQHGLSIKNKTQPGRSFKKF